MDDFMKDCFVGPTTVGDFFDAFLPVPFPENQRARLPGFGVMARIKKEEKMFTAFSRIANSICTTIRACNTSKFPFGVDGKEKPDITFYDTNTSDSPIPITCFQRMEMYVEFKREDDSDPFHSEDRRSFHKLFENPCETRNLIVLYAACMQVYQFRTCVFSVGIFGKVARLFRFDRSGATFTEPIPYFTGGNRDLSEFFYRFDLMDRAQRGWDPTVFDATPEETTSFDGAINAAIVNEKNSSLKSLLTTPKNKNRFPRKRVEVEGEDGRMVSYIVGRQAEIRGHPTGRGTRGFVALSTDTNKLVFLKDSWRIDSEEMAEEAEMFRRLKGARNISAFLHGSDVGRVVAERHDVVETESPPPDSFQCTLNAWFSELHGFESLMGYVHYRMVQSELYVPLNTFRDSKHLTQIMYDVAIALEDLYEAGIQHRDISEANIMISADGRGRLIDLDMAWDRYDCRPEPASAVGTSRFMSTELLSRPRKSQELSDDLESLWFVLLFEALHFVKHSMPDGIDMATIFDHEHVSSSTGRVTRGMGKVDLYQSDHDLITEELEFNSKPFTALIRQIYLLFRSLQEYHRIWYEFHGWWDSKEEPSAAITADARKLLDCEEIKRLLEEALNSEDWPAVCDKVRDQYPSAAISTPQQKDATAPSCGNPPPVPSGAPSGVKRKREEEDAPPVSGEVKRPKRFSQRLRLQKSKLKG